MRTALLAAAGSAVLLVGPLAGSAAADEPNDDERVVSYAATLDVAGDGALSVREEIVYDFGEDDHHGLQRFIPVRAPYDQTHDRSYPVTNLRVSSPSGAATQVESETEGDFLDVRVGDPDSEDVSGEQTYVLTYTVPAVVDTLADGSLQVAWDAVGTGWQVPIGRVDVTLTAPGPVAEPRCLTGQEGSTEACEARATATGATFAATDLEAEEGVTVTAGLPAGALAPAAPLLVDTFSPAQAFALDPTSLGGVLAVLLAGAVAVLTGRRRRPGPGPKTVVGVTDVPPGVLGALVHGGARDVDVVATLLDLAQRGHLVIEEEVAPDGDVGDWHLERTGTPDGPTPAEQRLLDTVFRDGPRTSLSAVRTTARDGTARTKRLLEDDAVSRGLFRVRPAQIVGRWALAGVLVVVAGGVATVLLALWTSLALVGLAVVVVGVAVVVAGLAGAGGSPLTEAGRDVRVRSGEFATTLARYGDADALVDGASPAQFTRLVPYAVALDATSAWVAGARALQAARAPLAAPHWYAGRASDGSTFNVALFAGMMGGFSASTSDALSAAPPTTSSTSSGGGAYTGGAAGGGGGGSW